MPNTSNLYFLSGTLAAQPVLAPLQTSALAQHYVNRFNLDRAVIATYPLRQANLPQDSGGDGQQDLPPADLPAAQQDLESQLLKLRCQLQGRHKNHDTPHIKPPRLWREP
jgi:hypothetical protein